MLDMRTWTIAFLMGNLVFIRFAPGQLNSWLLIFSVLLLISLKFTSCRCFILFIFGFFVAMFRAELILMEGLEKKLESETLLVTGEVSSLTEQRRYGIRFLFDIERMSTDNGISWHDKRLKTRLNWYQRPGDVVPGEKWQFQVRLKRPYGFRNPGGFDYEGWLFQQRIRALGYIIASGNNRRLHDHDWYSLDSVRYSLRTTVSRVLEEHPFKGLIVALGLGDRSLIPEYQNQILRNTGTSHLLAISGLHIGLVAGVTCFITFRIIMLLGWVSIYPEPVRLSVCISILAAFIYAALAGLSIPTQRALIMLIVFFSSLMLFKTVAFTRVLLLAMLIVLVIDPFAAINSSFWLSFGAITFIFHGMSNRVNTGSLWWRWGRVQWLLTVGLLPLLVFWLQQFPVAGFPANLLAIPWISFCVIPLVLAGILLTCVSSTLSAHCISMAANSLALFWPVLDVISDLSPALTSIASPDLFRFVFATTGIVIFLFPAGFPGKWLGLVWVLPLFLPLHVKPSHNEFRFTLLDVGQGLSAVIQTENHVLLYDTGPQYSEHFNAGQSVIVPFLKYHGIRSLDRIIVSHGDNDHIGGLVPVLSVYPDAHVLTSVRHKIVHPFIDDCITGQSWQWDGINFHILSPDDSGKPDDNNRSCVLKVSRGMQSVLLTGDIEKEAEQRLLHTRKKDLSVKILVAPHHGSKTSSMPAFIDSVSPEYVLFPTGYLNRFNLPNQDIIERYRSRGIRMLNSAYHGAISIEFKDKDMSINTFRQTSQHVWHTR